MKALHGKECMAAWAGAVNTACGLTEGCGLIESCELSEGFYKNTPVLSLVSEFSADGRHLSVPDNGACH